MTMQLPTPAPGMNPMETARAEPGHVPAILRRVERAPGETEGFDVVFFCPGCRCGHGLIVRPESPKRWTWNGSYERPTFSPSILIESGNAAGPLRCHSFVSEGRIQFLGDCTHPLANQTVPLEPF